MERIYLKDQCTGCGNCLDHCPKHLLRLSDDNDLNIRNTRYIQIKDVNSCINCKNCEIMCTAGAIKTNDDSYRLINKNAIPPHAGCYLGSLTKALAMSITNLAIQDKVVIFKKKASDVNLHVEIHDYDNEDFYLDGLQYKKENPDKIVILICAMSKSHTTSLNESRYRNLVDEKVTIISTSNWFEVDDFGNLKNGGSHILEDLKESKLSYLARGGVKTPKQIKELSSYITQAIQNQLDNKNTAIVEMIFPCFYRLANRPQVFMTYEEIKKINEWFEKNVAEDYSTGIIK